MLLCQLKLITRLKSWFFQYKQVTNDKEQLLIHKWIVVLTIK